MKMNGLMYRVGLAVIAFTSALGMLLVVFGKASVQANVTERDSQVTSSTVLLTYALYERDNGDRVLSEYFLVSDTPGVTRPIGQMFVRADIGTPVLLPAGADKNSFLTSIELTLNSGGKGGNKIVMRSHEAIDWLTDPQNRVVDESFPGIVAALQDSAKTSSFQARSQSNDTRLYVSFMFFVCFMSALCMMWSVSVSPAGDTTSRTT